MPVLILIFIQSPENAANDELFPWDFIDIGVAREFLRREWEQCHERDRDPELPDAVFRLWGSKIWRRCLL